MGSRNPLAGSILLFIICLTCLTDINTGRSAQAQRAPIQFPKPPEMNDPDTVVLTVSVTDKQDNAVPALTQDQFHVFENGVEQKLTYFWEDARPLTVGFVFDDSYRMKEDSKNDALKDAGSSFLSAANLDDEYFIIRAGDSTGVVQSFSKDPAQMLKVYSSSGSLALYDSIFLGMEYLKEAANDRKVLLVITAGGDTCGHSIMPCCEDHRRVSDQALTEFALRQPIQIYSLMIDEQLYPDAIITAYQNAPELPCTRYPLEDIPATDNMGRPIILDRDMAILLINKIKQFVNHDANVLGQLATITGGQMRVAPNDASGVEHLTAAIARGLKTQYLVGYKSTNVLRDGKRRNLKIKVDASLDAGKLNIWTSSGTYAAKEKKEKK
jgi:VWFA-related protein